MPIERSGGGGGSAAGLIKLFDSGYLGADAASIDTGAGGIASGHFALQCFGYLRSSAANTSDNVLLTFNNDSSALYDVNRIQNANTTVTGASVSLGTSANIGNIPGSLAPAHTFGNFLLNVPAYDGSANFKSCQAFGGATQSTVANNNQNIQSAVYESTTAISRLAIVAAGGNLVAGSRLVIFGVM